jgi:ATP-dependent Clp protease ATP-binding subunit ClpA
MARITTHGIDPTGSFYQVIGRAEEIARSLGSPVAGPEHYFLGLLHANSWPVSFLADRGILDPAVAEAAVLAMIGAPGYSPPASAPPSTRENVLLLAGQTAAVMGASQISELHAFLAIIRQVDTVRARAIARALAVSGAGLAEAEAVLAEHAAARPVPPDGAVILPADQDFDDELSDALVAARGPKAGLAVGVTADDRIWMHGADEDSRAIVNTALAALQRPTV